MLLIESRPVIKDVSRGCLPRLGLLWAIVMNCYKDYIIGKHRSLRSHKDYKGRASRRVRVLMRFSQSKLSQEQLNQLQRDTHFDKKELQQWYKGSSCRIHCLSNTDP